MTLGQRAINTGEKTNEIPIVQDLLKSLNIKGKIITADAMHCQKDTCEMIKAGQGDYVLGIKGNQHNFYKDIKLFMDDEANQPYMNSFETLEKNGGRVGRRIIRPVKMLLGFLTLTNGMDSPLFSLLQGLLQLLGL